MITIIEREKIARQWCIQMQIGAECKEERLYDSDQSGGLRCVAPNSTVEKQTWVWKEVHLPPWVLADSIERSLSSVIAPCHLLSLLLTRFTMFNESSLSEDQDVWFRLLSSLKWTQTFLYSCFYVLVSVHFCWRHSNAVKYHTACCQSLAKQYFSSRLIG